MSGCRGSGSPLYVGNVSPDGKYKDHSPKRELTLSTRLEATFGVIAAAAPSVRPLLGHNSVTTDDYSRSKPQSRAVPLHHLSRSGHGSRHSWLPSQRDHMQELKDDEDVESDGGSSQVKLWASKKAGIVKTTDVQIFHSPLPDGGRARSSDELLVSRNH